MSTFWQSVYLLNCCEWRSCPSWSKGIYKMFDPQSQHQIFRSSNTNNTNTNYKNIFILFGYGFCFFYRMTKSIPYWTICPSMANRNNSSLLYMYQNVYKMYETQSQHQKKYKLKRTKQNKFNKWLFILFGYRFCFFIE